MFSVTMALRGMFLLQPIVHAAFVSLLVVVELTCRNHEGVTHLFVPFLVLSRA